MNFQIIAWVLFLVIKAMNRVVARGASRAAAAGTAEQGGGPARPRSGTSRRQKA